MPGVTDFDTIYSRLNSAQRSAVDTIDGPLLVIAGPGTGKTQLLSARTANIIRRTDTPPQNILCLTFTESGAENMRTRLGTFIGRAAYDVTISTYHAFGSDLIARYPEYFPGTRLQKAVDELSRRQILSDITEAMSFTNPLKQTRHHIGDLIATLSEVKRALLTSDDLRSLARENLEFITGSQKPLQQAVSGFTRMPTKLALAQPYFEVIQNALKETVPSKPANRRFGTLAALCLSELDAALQAAVDSGKTTPLTAWKNSWLAKDADNQFIVGGELANRRISAMAGVLDAYQAALAAKGLFDFDDMILRTIQALETNDDFRYTLQERYLYVLLDEFQDTNAAQLRLVQLLTDNPVNEGRPNIMAVGDDDQAIYAFQGAQYSNMLEFHTMYRDTTVINLTENYRSQPDILTVASAIAAQVGQGLSGHFPSMGKQLVPATAENTSKVERREFQSDIAERAWVAGRIRQLIDGGTLASQIAVLAPKHKYLEPLVPYLGAAGVPVRYEKRENILEAPIVRQLVVMCRLVTAISAGDTGLASTLWPQVLSYEFWAVPTADIWKLSWQVGDSRSRLETSNDIAPARLTWNQAVLAAESAEINRAGEVILAAAGRLATETAETILDYLIGGTAAPYLTDRDEQRQGNAYIPGTEHIVVSPLKAYYTSAAVQQARPDIFYETLTQLTVLRRRLSEFQDQADSPLMTADFLRFIAMYEAAEQPMINTSPYSQQAESVQLSTVFKAKGLEYEHVFLIGCSNEIWGSAARGNSNKLTLPANLQPIRYAGATDDERLRILFVAITRAKQGLYLTSSTTSYSGKRTKRLKYFDEQQQPDGSVAAMVLPEHVRTVRSDDSDPPSSQTLELDWRSRHLDSKVAVDLKSLLTRRLDNYTMTPSQLISFIDLEYGGPQQVFFRDVLKFPSAPSVDSQFGSAVHETLEWYQHRVDEHGFEPTLSQTLEYFGRRIQARPFTPARMALEIERGQRVVPAYLKARGHIYKPGDIAEKDFYSENVLYGDVRLTGRIDRLEVDQKAKTITVVDYKTGKSYNAWSSDAKLYKYQLQLYAYKLLIEGSRTYKGYTVTAGRLEFVEPDDNGRINMLELQFTDDKLQQSKQLLEVVWRHVRALDFPVADTYPPTLAGIKQFEHDLIAGKL